MKIHFFLIALVTGLSFGIWPMIATKSHAQAWMIMFSVSLITTVMLGLLFFDAKPNDFAVTNGTWKLLVIAGVLNAIGWFGNYIIFRQASIDEFSILMITIGIIIPIGGALGTWLILKQSLSPRQLVGIAFGIIAILLLSKK